MAGMTNYAPESQTSLSDGSQIVRWRVLDSLRGKLLSPSLYDQRHLLYVAFCTLAGRRDEWKVQRDGRCWLKFGSSANNPESKWTRRWIVSKRWNSAFSGSSGLVIACLVARQPAKYRNWILLFLFSVESHSWKQPSWLLLTSNYR